MNKLFERVLNRDADVYVVDMESERTIHLMDKYRDTSVKHVTARQKSNQGIQANS